MTEDTTPLVASILAWRYEYRFLTPDRVDIDVHLTFSKEDDTPIVVGASLFAAGDTTPSGVVDAGAGVYDVMLPIRGFRCVPWTPHTVAGGAQKRYLLNMKLTTVPESEFDEPDVFAFLGGTIGFCRIDETLWTPHMARWLPQPEDGDATALRARLMLLRTEGIDLLMASTAASEDLYSLCDELGIAVSQEITANTSFLDEIRRLRHHPCLQVWISDGSSEIDAALKAEDPTRPVQAGTASGAEAETIS